MTRYRQKRNVGVSGGGAAILLEAHTDDRRHMARGAAERRAAEAEAADADTLEGSEAIQAV